MVTQKEYLEQKRAELKDAMAKHAAAQASFEKVFASELVAIDELGAEEDRLERLMKRNRSMVAAKVSEHPEMYASGSSHYLTKQVKDALAQRFSVLDSDASSVVWHAFHDATDKVNASVETVAHAIRQKRYNIEQAEPFATRRADVMKLKDDAHWLVGHIEHLSDLSKFRQWAKNMKEMEAKNEVRKQKEVAEKELQDWLVTEVFKLDDLMAKAYKAE